jgi:hypothetical protein
VVIYHSRKAWVLHPASTINRIAEIMCGWVTYLLVVPQNEMVGSGTDNLLEEKGIQSL